MPRVIFRCLFLKQRKTPSPISKPRPSATPNTMPTTLPVLSPPPPDEVLPSTGLDEAAGSAEVGVTSTVLTLPVTVMILVKTWVSVGGVLGEDGDGDGDRDEVVTTVGVVTGLGED